MQQTYKLRKIYLKFIAKKVHLRYVQIIISC
jgi:hypothetical protein